MSDLGLLSHHHQIMAELARQLRYNVLQLKRLYYGLPLPKKNEEIDPVIYLENVQRVIEFLHEVIPLTEEQEWPERWLDDPPLPIVLVEQLKISHILDQPKYINDLQRLAQRLQQRDVKLLKEKDIVLLEEIAQSASSDANTVFRKLMRWA